VNRFLVVKEESRPNPNAANETMFDDSMGFVENLPEMTPQS
jgi:hypothetical protein